MRREEMSRIASDVKNRIKSDVCNQLNNFFRTHGVSIEDFSSFTRIHCDDIRRILGGDTNMSLDTFVKIMLATGNAIEIKPIVPKRRDVGKGMPRPHGRMPFPAMGEMPCMPFGEMINENRPRPWENNHEINENTNRFQMEENGDLNEVREGHNFHSLSREELVNIVIDMGLENAIDLRRATRSALIDFLTLSTTPNVDASRCPSFENGSLKNEGITEREKVVSNDKEREFSKMMEKIGNMLSSNPQLMEKMAKLFSE